MVARPPHPSLSPRRGGGGEKKKNAGGGYDPDQLSVVVARPRSLLHAEQLDIEHQRGVRWDHPAGAARAIAEFGRDDQGALAADLHAGDALVPALDDLPGTQAEAEGLAAI